MKEQTSSQIQIINNSINKIQHNFFIVCSNFKWLSKVCINIYILGLCLFYRFYISEEKNSKDQLEKLITKPEEYTVQKKPQKACWRMALIYHLKICPISRLRTTRRYLGQDWHIEIDRSRWCSSVRWKLFSFLDKSSAESQHD